MSGIDFSFAIVNWNTCALLDRCLASIVANTGDFRVQILVADNASSDGSVEMVRTNYPHVELVQHERNLGFAAGHKPLFELSRGRYHVLVNSDVCLLAGCLERLHKRLEMDPKIGVLGCCILDEHKQVQASCRRFPSLAYQLIEASGLNRVFPRHPLFRGYKMGDFDGLSSRRVDQVMGSFFLIRRELIEAVGTLDTAFFMYYEEVDYCLRCYAAGYHVFYEADARIIHEGGGSSKMVKTLTIRRTMRSMRTYFRKNHGAWTWLPLMVAVSLDVVTHVFHALIGRAPFLATLKAYLLGWWDFLTFKRADL